MRWLASQQLLASLLASLQAARLPGFLAVLVCRHVPPLPACRPRQSHPLNDIDQTQIPGCSLVTQLYAFPRA